MALIKTLSIIGLLLTIVSAKYALNFNVFEKADLNKDGKLSKAQLLESIKTAILKSVLFI